MELSLEVNDAFVPHLKNTARTQIYYGGAGSGKSVFIAQRGVLDVLEGGRNYLICRAVGRYIKKSVWTQVRNVIIGMGLVDMFTFHIVAGVIECKHNGYQFIFTGLDDPEKLKSIVPAKGAITDIWIEEATETDKNTVRNLYKRQRGGDPNIPKRLTLSFNPIMQTNWIYQEYFNDVGWADDQTEYISDELTIMKTWYIHNRFLTVQDVYDLESEKNEYFHQVYTLGNWGVLGNVIFTNWEVQDLSEMQDQFTRRRNGLDFGFSADPAAVIATHYDRDRKIIYVFKEFYERGLTNDLLAEEVLALIGQDHVVCDSAEPKSIAELTKYNVSASGAKKGKDSVLFGIQWLQQQRIIIDTSCINTRNEFMQYQWKEDRVGNAMRQPVEKNDHLISALRYAYENDMEATWWINWGQDE